MQGSGALYRGEHFTVTEGSLAPVSCLEGEDHNCNRAGQCQTLEMWEGLNKLINDYFDGITIADLIHKMII